MEKSSTGQPTGLWRGKRGPGPSCPDQLENSKQQQGGLDGPVENKPQECERLCRSDSFSPSRVWQPGSEGPASYLRSHSSVSLETTRLQSCCDSRGSSGPQAIRCWEAWERATSCSARSGSFLWTAAAGCSHLWGLSRAWTPCRPEGPC